MSIATASKKGSRYHQEDRFFAYTPTDDMGGLLLGVLDGHGGDEVSTLLEQLLPIIWQRHACFQKPEEIFKRVFAEAHEYTKLMRSGSTTSLVYISPLENFAHIAVLGDSPVIVEQGDGQIYVGPDHNARSNVAEREAAITRGATYDGAYVYDNILLEGLQMTRAFGDTSLSRILNREPEIATVTLGRWLLVGSDGLLDPTHMKNDPTLAVVQAVRKGADAEKLVQRAVSLPASDNVTAILWRRDDIQTWSK